MIRRKIFPFLTLILVGCQNVDKKFLVSNDNVGSLTKQTLVKDLEQIFEKDSIAKENVNGSFTYMGNQKILVFEKGKSPVQLLELIPSPESSKEEKIVSIEILDPRFQTKEGISLKSDFAQIKKVYKDFEITPSLFTISVTPKDSNIYFVYDKKDLMTKATEDQYTIQDIPDVALMKKFMLSWAGSFVSASN